MSGSLDFVNFPSFRRSTDAIFERLERLSLAVDVTARVNNRLCLAESSHVRAGFAASMEGGVKGKVDAVVGSCFVLKCPGCRITMHVAGVH